jgi:hypothetical protein
MELYGTEMNTDYKEEKYEKEIKAKDETIKEKDVKIEELEQWCKNYSQAL